MISEKEGVVTIDSYESTTFFILKRLLDLSHIPNREQQKSNEKYLRECGIEFKDELKRIAMKYLFVSSQVMLIYGAAGTGKTTSNKIYFSNDEAIKKTVLGKNTYCIAKSTEESV